MILKIRHILYYIASLLIMAALFHTSGLAQSASFINPLGTTVETRFMLPDGYERVPAPKNSYAYFLRRLQMLPYGTIYSNSSSEAHFAGMLNMVQINNMQQDIHLCVRLRAEYFFKQEQYDKIGFTISNFTRIFYVPWVEGLKLVINDKQHWTKQSAGVDRLRTFYNYLGFIFNHSDINTVQTDLQPISINNIMPGDMFIQISHPGKAVIVLDVAYNLTTGDRIFLLAKTYSAARTASVLVNPKEAWSGSPWYTIKVGENKITTPEFVFYKQDLRRFQGVLMTSKK